MDTHRKSRIGFALEYSLGHTTHAQNLKKVLAESSERVEPMYVDLPYDGMTGRWTRLPGVRSNWSLRASLGAYLALRGQADRLDGALFHTQVTSLFSTGLMRRMPSVVSLDATPLQYDALGRFYGHQPSGSAALEAFKKRMNERAFSAARRLVTWSEWAKGSLVADYGVPADKIVVIPPGIDIAAWNRSERSSHPRKVHLLFVGGDFERKGGVTLLAALHGLSPEMQKRLHLHVVTRTEQAVQEAANVSVYHNVTPNSDVLRALFARADVFVFPTRGDCLPLAVLEALASSLPVITTSVGALPEAVQHGRTGWIVPPDDPVALGEALERLIGDDALRAQMGQAARYVAEARFDAKKNYEALVDTVLSVTGASIGA